MSEVIQISLDGQGRIVIQSPFYNRLGLSQGMTLVVESGEKDDEVRLRIQGKEPLLIDKQGVLVVRAEPWGNLIDITRQERDRRVFDLVQRPCRNRRAPV